MVVRQLALADRLTLPLDAVTQKFAFLGKTGSGKTYGATKLAELMLAAKAQVIALDPVGVWYGLRLAADGNTPGIQIPVFGGLYGDIPLEPTAGAVMADVIVDRGISAVIDVSQFEYDSDKAKFASEFARRLFFRKKSAPSALHLFLEEGQEFLPQNPQRGEERMLHEFTRIGKVGRNYGFGWSIISQRPQEINKKALNLTECVLAFQTNGVHERKAISEWVKEKGEDVDVVELLPKLKVGFAHAWSPSWLEVSETVHVNKKDTFNASATPKVGAAVVESRPLAPIDLERIQKDMAATIEKSKSEDPKELQRTVAQLRARIRKLEAAPGKTVEKAVPDQAAISRAVNTAIAAERKERAKAHGVVLKATESIERAVASLRGIASPGEIQAPAIAEPQNRPAPSFVASTPRIPRTTGGTMGSGEQRILNAVAELNSLGIERTSRAQVGVVAEYNLSGGTPAGYVGSLVEQGLLTIPRPGELALTSEGAARADSGGAPGTLRELHQRVLGKLGDGERRILEHLIAIFPDYQPRSSVGEAVGYNLSGGTPAGYVGKLVTLGFVEIPDKGALRASDVLFPAGLA